MTKNAGKKETRAQKANDKAEQKIQKAKSKSPEAGAKAEKKYGYNYDSALKAGLLPEDGHWPSRNPETGEILKGRKHPTINKTKKGEREAGYKITKQKGGTLYSQPKKTK
jgi:hypothetical protein